MKSLRRINTRLLLPSAVAFIVLETLFAVVIFLYCPRPPDLMPQRQTASAELVADRLEGLLLAAAGLDALKQRWRADCDTAAAAVLAANPGDTAVGIFQGSSPICLHLRLSAPNGNQTALPAVLNPDSLAKLRAILFGGVLVALSMPPEWPGLVAVASALDAEGDQTALLVRVLPTSSLINRLAGVVSAKGMTFSVLDKTGASLVRSDAVATGSSNADLGTAKKASVEIASIDKTNVSVKLIDFLPDSRDAWKPVWHLFLSVTLMLAASVFSAASLLDRTIFAQLDTLKRVARLYSRGRFSVRFRPQRQMPLEIINLGLALNDMAGSSTRQTQALEETAAEESRLLLELHHRVKNNFQVVESLLSLLKKGRSAEQVVHLRFVEDHVRSMAVADRVAYGAHGMNVPIDELIGGVVDGLRTAANLPGKQVRLELGPFLGTLDLDRAIALCLCLAVVVPVYFKEAAAEVDLIHISVQLEPVGVRVSVSGATAALEPAPFLRHRLVQAYLRQLDAAPGSGWDLRETEQRFCVIIPNPTSSKAA